MTARAVAPLEEEPLTPTEEAVLQRADEIERKIYAAIGVCNQVVEAYPPALTMAVAFMHVIVLEEMRCAVLGVPPPPRSPTLERYGIMTNQNLDLCKAKLMGGMSAT